MINSNKEQQWLKPSNVLFKTTCSKRLQLMGTNCTDTRSDLSLIREEVFQQIGSPPIVLFKIIQGFGMICVKILKYENYNNFFFEDANPLLKI
jgi:hypothetical protein